jgi:hypothetical protein
MSTGTKRVRDESAQQPRSVRPRSHRRPPSASTPPAASTPPPFMLQRDSAGATPKAPRRPQCSYIKRDKDRCDRNATRKDRCRKHCRCNADGCERMTKGATDFCVGHGGGRRCNFPQCSKSADGATDTCRAHDDPKQNEEKAKKKAARAEEKAKKAAEEKAATAQRAALAPKAKDVDKQLRRLARAELEKLEANMYENAKAAGVSGYALSILRDRPSFVANKKGSRAFYVARSDASMRSNWLNTPVAIPDTFF